MLAMLAMLASPFSKAEMIANNPDSFTVMKFE